jgi:hypothetical protein
MFPVVMSKQKGGKILFMEKNIAKRSRCSFQNSNNNTIREALYEIHEDISFDLGKFN